MNTIQKTLRVLLTGMVLFLASSQVVWAQQTVTVEKLLQSENPGELLFTLSQEEAENLVASLSDDQRDQLVLRMMAENSRPEGSDAQVLELLKELRENESNVSTFSTKVDSFSVSTGVDEEEKEDVIFEYIDIRNRNNLMQLALSMDDSRDYPVVVFKKDVFVPGMEILRTMDLQIKNYQHKDEQWKTLDSIHKAKYAQLENIVNLQVERVENYRSANEQLNVQIKQLSDQLTTSVELTEKSLKGRTRRNLWIGTLGGVFGFSLGVLISAL